MTLASCASTLGAAAGERLEADLSTLNLKISAFSTALYSTWIFVEQWKLLLDAGDGAAAGLLGKSRKVHTVALTHAHRDHLTGLPQLLQLNGHQGTPRLLYPRDAGSFPALATFLGRFDEGTSSQATWLPVAPGDVVPLQGDLRLRVLSNDHWSDVPPGQVKCLGYTVEQAKQVLRGEFRGLKQAELDAIRASRGREALMVEEVSDLLTFTGDTPVVEPARWGKPAILLHEATFLDEETAKGSKHRRNRHSHLRGALEVAMSVGPEALVLTHFSPRYSVDEVLVAIQRECAALGVPFPVWCVPPAILVPDVLGAPPVWDPTVASARKHS